MTLNVSTATGTIGCSVPFLKIAGFSCYSRHARILTEIVFVLVVIDS